MFLSHWYRSKLLEHYNHQRPRGFGFDEDFERVHEWPQTTVL